MFIDYAGIMLVGIAAGLVLLADYLWRSPEAESRMPWAAGFFAAGILGLATSIPMVITWPLPGSYNIAFGEAALYLSVAFIGAAITLSMRWEPLIPAIYGFFGGIMAVIIGLRIGSLGLTKEPFLTLVGYVATGLGGILTLPAIQYRNTRTIALIAAGFLALGALVFLVTGYVAYWSHLSGFAKWLPPTMAAASTKAG